MADHYIRTDESGVIILGFSSDFVQPLETDILVEADAGRHYNPEITNELGQFLYRWENGFVPIELPAPPPPPPSLEDRTKANEDAINFLLGTVIL